MRVKRTRAARYALVVPVILTDLETGHQIQGNTWDVSAFGCQVMTGNGTRIGTRVRIQINYKGDVFEAQGLVMNMRPLMGAGVVFKKVEDSHRMVLEKWLEELRSQKSEKQ